MDTVLLTDISNTFDGRCYGYYSQENQKWQEKLACFKAYLWPHPAKRSCLLLSARKGFDEIDMVMAGNLVYNSIRIRTGSA